MHRGFLVLNFVSLVLNRWRAGKFFLKSSWGLSPSHPWQLRSYELHGLWFLNVDGKLSNLDENKVYNPFHLRIPMDVKQLAWTCALLAQCTHAFELISYFTQHHTPMWSYTHAHTYPCMCIPAICMYVHVHVQVHKLPQRHVMMSLPPPPLWEPKNPREVRIGCLTGLISG